MACSCANAAAHAVVHRACLKKALTSDLVVRVANPKLPYILEVDASQVAVGGILMQQHPDAPIPQVVEYYSKRCGPSQSNYFPGKL